MGRSLIALVVISVVVYGVEIYGGQNVVLDGITVNEAVAGNGTGENGTAPFNGEPTGNSITLLINNNVYGAVSLGGGDVSENRVFINDSCEVGWSVYGGFVVNDGAAVDNKVEIRGGTIGISVFGGRVDDGAITNNIINISGG